MPRPERTEKFVLLAIKEDKDHQNTHFVGCDGEHAIGFYVKPEDIKWRMNDDAEKVTVETVTTDYGDFVSSTVHVEGPHEQLASLLSSLGFAPLPPPASQ